MDVTRVSSASNRRGTIKNEMVAHLVVKFWLPSIELLRVGFAACEFSCWAGNPIGSMFGFTEQIGLSNVTSYALNGMRDTIFFAKR